MAYLQKEVLTKAPERETEEYLSPSRWESVSHLKTEMAKKPTHTITDFLTKTIWSWLYHYVKSRFGPKYPYPAYSSGNTGIYTLEGGLASSIAITSDWATNTPESFAVARAMGNQKPDYTVHVGDTYYVGAPPEIYSNFVEEGSPWVRGRLGSFAVLGNHEMYAKGDAFFECLLPSLGVSNGDGVYKGQEAGFFCLQNDHWRILGLDTGYDSVGTPILEFLPGFSPKCGFDDIQMNWLRDVVQIGDPSDKRGLVILTHHQVISAFKKEHEYDKPAKQLASLLGRDQQVLWLWGHEHKLALYSKVQVDKNLSVYGRCIGHGGTPVQIKSDNPDQEMVAKKKGFPLLVAVDWRVQQVIKDKKKPENPDKATKLGYNGYAVLSLKDDVLQINYHDTESRLLTEEWVANVQTGTIEGSIPDPPQTKLVPVSGKSWSDAVG